jgi:hypothetical protein
MFDVDKRRRGDKLLHPVWSLSHLSSAGGLALCAAEQVKNDLEVRVREAQNSVSEYLRGPVTVTASEAYRLHGNRPPRLLPTDPEGSLVMSGLFKGYHLLDRATLSNRGSASFFEYADAKERLVICLEIEQETEAYQVAFTAVPVDKIVGPLRLQLPDQARVIS